MRIVALLRCPLPISSATSMQSNVESYWGNEGTGEFIEVSIRHSVTKSYGQNIQLDTKK